MRRFFLIIVSIVILLVFASCGAKPEDTVPEDTSGQEEAYDLVIDMKDYGYFADVFEEKPVEEWEAMGTYTISLRGMHTPVLVNMHGMDVLSVSAYGQTLTLNQGAYQGYVGIEIEATESVLIIYQIDDYESSCWLLTEEKCYALHPEGGYSTTVHVREDGTLRYRKFWGEYDTTFDQEEYAPLYYCTSRDDVLYQIGSVGITDGQVVLTPEKTVTADDEYDLDAMFAEAKADEYAGEYFSRFETVEEALAANVNR